MDFAGNRNSESSSVTVRLDEETEDYALLPLPDDRLEGAVPFTMFVVNFPEPTMFTRDGAGEIRVEVQGGELHETSVEFVSADKDVLQFQVNHTKPFACDGKNVDPAPFAESDDAELEEMLNKDFLCITVEVLPASFTDLAGNPYENSAKVTVRVRERTAEEPLLEDDEVAAVIAGAVVLTLSACFCYALFKCCRAMAETDVAQKWKEAKAPVPEIPRQIKKWGSWYAPHDEEIITADMKKRRFGW